ncbi:DUF397 domain-containing protein [Streptomyces sp. NPDC088124]|uniref:DUF397 domain-containing protein n=1 Tax=Streptomyces sp. NPDC088124 TaxID=3154654 RepID=UPI00342DFC69
MTQTDPLKQARWRKSSYSGGGGDTGGDCVETALLPDGRVAFRDSKRPEAAVVFFGRAQTVFWLRYVKAGEPGDVAG